MYTLKVKYYNALEAITTALDTYFSAPTTTNVTYTKTANQQYNVVTHVSSMNEITNGGLISTLLTITNLTKVTLTVGDNSTEVTTPTIASDFDVAITWLADQLHWDVSFTDPVTVVMKVEAGDASVDYTFSVTCDYDQIATAKALTDAVLATAHDDEYLTLTPIEDGSVEVVFKKPADQMIDTIGFGNLLKTLPHLKSVTFSMRYSSTGEQTPVTATIDAPVTDEKLTELKTTLGTILPADDTAVLVLSTTKFYYDNVNISDGIDRSTTYEASISSSWVADPEVIINDTARYHTLAEGLAAATSGDTVTLQKHITVSNNQVNATPNSPVITIPDGVTFDGNNKVITADDASWVGTNANHIIGVSNVTATIKNLTVAGNTKTKSGIVCFGQNGNVTLENVVAQNCGNCGVQVAGARVTATNLQTVGNVWGGVNVDKGSDGSTPHFAVDDTSTFAEKAEVYTEITDQEVITAPSLTKYQGFGDTLKGFIYYTSDVSKLGTVYNGAVYETVNDILENNETVELAVDKDITESIIVPAGKTLNLNLNNHVITNAAGEDTLVNNGTMTISGDGTIDNTETNKAALTNNGTLTILGGTISRSQDTGVPDDSTHPGYYTLVNHGTMVIGTGDGDNSGIVISSTGGYSALVENGWYDSTGKTPENDTCKLTIYGGTFQGGKYSVKNDELGETTIYGGKFEKPYNVNLLNWHNMYIHGGTFDCTEHTTNNLSNGKYGQGVGHVEITNGEFIAKNKSNVILTSGYNSSDITISGGVFTSKVGLSNYLADGYEIDSEINPGKYTVTEIKAAEINGTTYPTVADAIASVSGSDPVEITILKDATENLTIPVGKNITIQGSADQPATINGKISCVANGSGETNLTLKNLTLDGTGTGTTYGIISQNQTDNGQMECNLVLENVNITGFASKAIYGTNIKTLTITGGTIADCATGTMDDPNTKGDYAVDLNLVAVQGTVVTIDGVTFSGDLGDKAAIKITQRGGASDAGASDIPKNVGEAHVEKVTIQNCDFSASTTEVDYRIGTDNKTGGDSLNTTGAYAAELINNGEIIVQSAYLVDEPKLTVPAGRDAAKTSETDIAIVLTPEEQLDAIMANIEGATETSNNVYEVTTDTSVNLAFIDQIVAISGFNSMQVSNGTDTLTYTNDGILEEFKSQVAAWMPATNESPELTLTITVNFAE